MSDLIDPPIDVSDASQSFDKTIAQTVDGPVPEGILNLLDKKNRDRVRAMENVVSAAGGAAEDALRNVGRHQLLGRGRKRSPRGLKTAFGYLDELNRAAKDGEPYAQPRGVGEPPAKLKPVEDIGDIAPQAITQSAQMVGFNVYGKADPDKVYHFRTVHPYRGLMVPMSLAPLTAVPDKRFPNFTWYLLPSEIAGEANVREVARNIIARHEEVHQGVLPQKPVGEQKPKTEMQAFSKGSLANSKRYKFLTQAGWAGLWAENRSFNQEGQHERDEDFPNYWRVASPEEMEGRVVIERAAMRMIEDHEGIKFATDAMGEPMVRGDKRGQNYSVYLRQADIDNMKTIQEHIATLDASLNNASKTIQIALNEAARRLKRYGKLDWEDA